MFKNHTFVFRFPIFSIGYTNIQLGVSTQNGVFPHPISSTATLLISTAKLLVWTDPLGFQFPNKSPMGFESTSLPVCLNRTSKNGLGILHTLTIFTPNTLLHTFHIPPCLTHYVFIMGEAEIQQANDPCPRRGARAPRVFVHGTTNFSHVAVTIDVCSQGEVTEASDERKFR